MRKFLLLIPIVILLLLKTQPQITRAQDCTPPSAGDNLLALEQKKEACQHAWDLMEQAIKPHKEELSKMEADIASFQKRIKQIEAELVVKEREISQGEAEIDAQTELLGEHVRQFYIRSYYNNPLILIFAKTNAAVFLREMAYQQAVTNQDKKIIGDISLNLKNLDDNRKELESEKTTLASLKIEIDKRAESVRKLVAEGTAYQQKIEVSLSALTAAQQNILSAKAETFQTSVGEVPLADDPAASPNYNPGFSPAFAAFSFGAPHFKGMSQYGALGRSKSGQSAEDILHAYYGDIEIKKDYDANKQIGVAGYDRMNIETYTKRIYEVPNSWGDEGGMEALKAQAVAARSYALAWTREGTGGNICTDEGCQVYKNADKGGKWEEAVNATRGWVLFKNGKIVSAWYASTSGGYQKSYDALAYLHDGSSYNTPAIWDTANGRNGWTSQAYEKIAGSPWFYKAWYKERGGATCGRSHPWLTQDEFTDILNAWVVFTRGNDEDKKHVTPPDTSCWGGDPYSIDKMRQRAGELGGAYTSISSVSVTYSSDGYTDSVNLGGTSISGSDFKTIFNLRAPGKISLKSSLFNIEKK